MTTAPGPDGYTIRAGFQPVMGTHLELQITTSGAAEARAAEQTALAEATRLEAVFTVFDPASDLCQWRSGSRADPGPELAALLALAACWQHRSGGAFNPMAGVLTERWLQGVADGAPPVAAELTDLAASIAVPRFTAADGSADRLGDCRAMDLNAIAKGHVVDLLAARVLADHEVSRLVVNAGGDLVHRGDGTVRVAVEDPSRAYDNGRPLTRIEISNAAVATSGRARRWFEIGGHRYSRVLDPRTGQPVSHTVSATVIAPDAATADVLATAASVLDPAATIDLLERLEADGLVAAALVVDRAGIEHRSAQWPGFEVPPSP